MVVARTLESKLASLYKAGKIVGGVYIGPGQEAISASIGSCLSWDHDIFSALIRDQAGRTAFGEPMLDATRSYLGSAKGPSRGRDGKIHSGGPNNGLPAMISHLGAMVSVVTATGVETISEDRLAQEVEQMMAARLGRPDGPHASVTGDAS